MTSGVLWQSGSDYNTVDRVIEFNRVNELLAWYQFFATDVISVVT